MVKYITLPYDSYLSMARHGVNKDMLTNMETPAADAATATTTTTAAVDGRPASVAPSDGEETDSGSLAGSRLGPPAASHKTVSSGRGEPTPGTPSASALRLMSDPAPADLEHGPQHSPEKSPGPGPRPGEVSFPPPRHGRSRDDAAAPAPAPAPVGGGGSRHRRRPDDAAPSPSDVHGRRRGPSHPPPPPPPRHARSRDDAAAPPPAPAPVGVGGSRYRRRPDDDAPSPSDVDGRRRGPSHPPLPPPPQQDDASASGSRSMCSPEEESVASHHHHHHSQPPLKNRRYHPTPDHSSPTRQKRAEHGGDHGDGDDDDDDYDHDVMLGSSSSLIRRGAHKEENVHHQSSSQPRQSTKPHHPTVAWAGLYKAGGHRLTSPPGSDSGKVHSHRKRKRTLSEDAEETEAEAEAEAEADARLGQSSSSLSDDQGVTKKKMKKRRVEGQMGREGAFEPRVRASRGRSVAPLPSTSETTTPVDLSVDANSPAPPSHRSDARTRTQLPPPLDLRGPPPGVPSVVSTARGSVSGNAEIQSKEKDTTLIQSKPTSSRAGAKQQKAKTSNTEITITNSSRPKRTTAGLHSQSWRNNWKRT